MSRRGERLSVLAELVGGRIVGDGDPIVLDATHDSRQVGAGSVFLAIRGMTSDGHDFIDRAVDRGASAIIAEEERALRVPVVVVDDTRAVMPRIAAAVHGNPSNEVEVVGITGTNGKTTVAWMLEAILEHAGVPTGLIGTIVTRFGEDRIPTLRTTPEATDLQRLLAAMVDRGAAAVVMEVSSHALALGRVSETRFEIVAFTNLSQDHLDFHEDMESYFGAKALLFDHRFAPRGIVCVDDDWGRRLANDAAIPVRTVSMGGDADLRASILERSLDATVVSFDLAEHGRWTARLPVIGDFNVRNVLVAVGCALGIGLDPDPVVAALEHLRPTPGRFELVSGDDPVRVIVDYAHTPDGIASVIGTVRGLTRGRIVAVIGAGGDRDRAKRPLMGAAGASADVLVVTSDNPRSEDPEAIIDDVVSGVVDHPVVRQADRRAAITDAVAVADDGDVVLVLGKGHERGQEIAGRVLPFDDRLVARSALEAKRAGTS